MHLGQHGHGPRPRLRGERIQAHLYDERQAVQGEDRHPAGGRSRGVRLSDQCPPDDPDSYYSVAERLHKETPNSVWCNQYDNLDHPVARHYETTGPEIWKQTGGMITHLTGGDGRPSAARPSISRRRIRTSMSGASTPTARCPRPAIHETSSTRWRLIVHHRGHRRGHPAGQCGL